MARDDEIAGVSCTLCLNADEADSMLIVPIIRRFSEIPSNLPFCSACVRAIGLALGLPEPAPIEESTDESSKSA